VVDCRRVPGADGKFSRAAAISGAVCDEVGWEYRLAAEPDPVLAANLTWLAGYRRPYVLDERTATVLLDGTAEPVPLLSAATTIGDPVAVLPTLFHLLWTGRLCCDLDLPLADHCPSRPGRCSPPPTPRGTGWPRHPARRPAK
jgi:hypothetical protein